MYVIDFFIPHRLFSTTYMPSTSKTYFYPASHLTFCSQYIEGAWSLLCRSSDVAAYSRQSKVALQDYPHVMYFYKDWKPSNWHKQFIAGIFYRLLLDEKATAPALWDDEYPLLTEYIPRFSHVDANDYGDSRCALWKCPSGLKMPPTLAQSRNAELDHHPLLHHTYSMYAAYQSYQPQAEGFAHTLLASALLFEYDLHPRNMGIVQKETHAWFARIDYDHSFLRSFPDASLQYLFPQGFRDADWFLPIHKILAEYAVLIPEMRDILMHADAQDVYLQLQEDMRDAMVSEWIQRFVADFPQRFEEVKKILLQNLAMAEEITAKTLPLYEQVMLVLDAAMRGDDAALHAAYESIHPDATLFFRTSAVPLPKDRFFMLGMEAKPLRYLQDAGVLQLPGYIVPEEWEQLHPEVRLHILQGTSVSFWDLYNDYLYPLNVPSVFHYLHQHHHEVDLCENLQPDWTNWFLSMVGSVMLPRTHLSWDAAIQSFGVHGAMRPDFISAAHYTALVQSVEDMHLMCQYVDPANAGKKDLQSAVQHYSLVYLAAIRGETILAEQLMMDGFCHFPGEEKYLYESEAL